MIDPADVKHEFVVHGGSREQILVRSLIHMDGLRREALEGKDYDMHGMLTTSMAGMAVDLAQRLCDDDVESAYHAVDLGAAEGKPVLLIGGDLRADPVPDRYRDHVAIAVQRAILRPGFRERADLLCVYDPRAWKILKLYEFEVFHHKPVVTRRVTLRSLFEMHIDGFCPLAYEAPKLFGAQGAGPYALAFAGVTLRAPEVVLHAFACEEDQYQFQIKEFAKVGQHLETMGVKVYETQGSKLGMFPSQK